MSDGGRRPVVVTGTVGPRPDASQSLSTPETAYAVRSSVAAGASSADSDRQHEPAKMPTMPGVQPKYAVGRARRDRTALHRRKHGEDVRP